MKALTQKAEIRKSKIHGWGVFAKEDIRKGELIEQCPFLITFGNNHKKMQDYLFLRTRDTAIIVLGCGSLYNHSENNNAEYFENTSSNLLEFIAKNKISKGEELFIDYGTKYFTQRGLIVK